MIHEASGSPLGRVMQGMGIGQNGGSPPKTPADANQVGILQALSRVLRAGFGNSLLPSLAGVGGPQAAVGSSPARPPAPALTTRSAPPLFNAGVVPGISPYGPFHSIVVNAGRL